MSPHPDRLSIAGASGDLGVAGGSPLTVVSPVGPASVVVRLSPSLFRMSAAGRLAVAAAIAALIWIATLTVIG